jgi:hypothetical protein
MQITDAIDSCSSVIHRLPASLVSRTSGTGESCAMTQGIIFVSTCTSCRREQPQDAFTVADLLRLLDAGYPIEAYCVPCDKFWSIGVQERVKLGEAVAVVSKRTLPASVPIT